MKNGNNNQEVAIAYIHGRVEAQIESFASSMGIPQQLLAARLAALLNPAGSGRADRMPAVPSDASPRGAAAVASSEVGAGAHRSSASRAGGTGAKEVNKGPRRYWNSLTPRQQKLRINKMQRAKAEKRRAA